MPSRTSAALVVLAALLVGPVGPAPASAQTDARLPVVASGTVIADLVRNVGGDSIALRPLAPAGTDPHTFQPTPDSMQALARARLAFFNGSGLEEWWGRTVRSVGRKDLAVVELSRGLATIAMPESPRGGHRHGAGLDPHVWLDPILVKTMIERIRQALVQLDPGRAAGYADRAARFQGKLDELDAWIRAETAKIPVDRRKIVTFHNAFQYFAGRYGFAVKGFVVASPGKEPSAKALADLIRRIRQEAVPAVFSEADFNPKIVESLGREAGVKVVTNLYDGSLSDGPPADTYLAMMRHNVASMVGALR